MGAVFILKCPRYRYKPMWEMWIVHRYRETHNTLKEISDEVWGKELQELSKEEDCAINIEEVMLVCDMCRAIDVRPSLKHRMRVRKINYRESPIDGKEMERMLRLHMN